MSILDNSNGRFQRKSVGLYSKLYFDGVLDVLRRTVQRRGWILISDCYGILVNMDIRYKDILNLITHARSYIII